MMPGSRSRSPALSRASRQGAQSKPPGLGRGFRVLLVEERAQVLASRRVAQLAQRLGFDLADPLAGHIELLADFLEGVVGVHVDAEPHAQHLGFAGGEPSQDFAGRFLEAFHRGDVYRRLHAGVFDEVSQVRIFVVTDRRFHGDRLLGDLQDLADLVLGHFHALAQLFRGRFATHLLQHLPRDTVELVDRLDHMHRDTDGPRLVGNGASDRLANPPGGVSRELVAATVFELVHRLHQADVAFLDQVEELQAAVGVLLGDGDHQTQVRFDHLFLRATGLGLADRHATVDVLDLGELQAGLDFQGDQLLLATLDVRLQATNGFGVFAFALGQLVGPALIDFIAGELAQEVGTRHPRIAHAQLHDGAFLGAQALQGIAHPDHQGVVLLGDQLDRHEQQGQFFQLGNALLAVAAMLLQDLVGHGQLVGHGAEAYAGDFRIRAAIALFLVVAVAVGFLFLGLGFAAFSLLDDRNRDFDGCGDAVIRVDVTAEDFGQAATLGGDTGVFGENAVDRAGEVRNGAHHLADAFLYAFGDFNFAFAGQQFDRAHFAHVHAHWVRGATDIGLDRSQGGGRFFRGRLIGVGFGQSQGVRIRSTLECV